MTGTPSPWEALLAERAWLARLARELVRGDAEAEELAADVLADASVGAAPRRAGPRAWLRAIARRQAALRARGAERRARRELRAARSEAQPSALEAAAAFEVQRAVAEAVAALAEPLRTTVLLRYWEDLPPREVARAMQCPVETVHSRTKRAHAQLRVALDARSGGRRDAWAVPLFLLQERVPEGSAGGLLLGAAIGGGAKLVLVAAVLVVAVGLWFGPREEDRELEIVSPVLLENAAPRAGTPASAVDRTPVAVGAPAIPAPLSEARELYFVRGRLVSDEDERALAPRAAYLRAEDGSRRGLPLRVGPEPERSFELELTRDEAHALRELGLELEGRSPFRRRLSAEALTRAPERVLDLGALRSLRGTRYRGRVVDRWGRGVAGAHLLVPRLRVAWSSRRFPENLLFDVERLGVADTDGSFELRERIEPAVEHSHLFAAAAEGLGWVPIAPSRRGELEPDPLELRLGASGDLRVRVLDEHGERVAGVRVVARPLGSPIGVARLEAEFTVSNDPLVAARFEARTDEHGLAQFCVLPIGDPAEGAAELAARYSVRVEPREGPAGPWYLVPLLAEREVELEIRNTALLAAVAEEQGREPVSSETCMFSGRATDPSGAPAIGFALFHAGRCLATIGADGAFRVERFPSGPQQVVLAKMHDAGPGWTGRFTPEVIDAAAGPVHFVLARRPDAGMPFRIELVAEESGAPLDPHAILLEPIDASGELEGTPARTRIEGSKVFAEGSSGRWRLGVRTACGRRWQGVLEVASGLPDFVHRCALPPTGSVEIELVAGAEALPEILTLHAELASPDPSGYANYAYAGAWQASAGAELQGEFDRPWLQSLRVRPALGRRFLLRHADTTQLLRITARGGGRSGAVELRALPHEQLRARLSLDR
jgi:RNA polymerase sigma-70 factor (ECF subfamily)